MYGPMFTNPTVGTEIKLNFEIENYKFRGVIDRLDKTENNTLIVTDYKTSKKQKDLLQQSQIYSLDYII